MPITQLQVGRRAGGTKLESGIQQTWLEAWPALEEIPIVTNGSLSVRWRRAKVLPTIGTRKLYGDFAQSYGGWEEQAFDLPIYGGKVQIDEQLLSEPGGAEEWADTIEAYTRAFAFRMANDTINGDTATDLEAMDGLKVLVAKLPARQTITPTAAIDLTTSANRKTNAPELIRYMHTAMHRVRQGTGRSPNLILMNDDLFLLLSDAMRQSGFLTTTMDNYGREVNKFQGARIVTGGYQQAEALTQTTEILGANFDGDGNTSMFFLVTGEQYVHYVQKHAMKVTEGRTNTNGSSDDDLILRTKMVEWPIALRLKHPYAAARLTKIDITP